MVVMADPVVTAMADTVVTVTAAIPTITIT